MKRENAYFIVKPSKKIDEGGKEPFQQNEFFPLFLYNFRIERKMIENESADIFLGDGV